jgi:hypothetical protein
MQNAAALTGMTLVILIGGKPTWEGPCFLCRSMYWVL